MLFAFVIGLLLSNFASSSWLGTGFVASQTRRAVYIAIGALAGIFSLVIGLVFLFGLEGGLPDLDSFLRAFRAPARGDDGPSGVAAGAGPGPGRLHAHGLRWTPQRRTLSTSSRGRPAT